jgi:SAM-dependent methyltransferase
MTVFCAGRDREDLEALISDQVAPSGTVRIGEPAALEGGLDPSAVEGADLVLIEFSPGALTEAGRDPVTVLDGYRAAGFRFAALDERLPEDPGELVLAIAAAGADSAWLRLRWLGREWPRRFPPDRLPGTLGYDADHRALIGAILDDEELRGRFAAGSELPAGFAAGFDERAVEYPWLFSQGLSGRVLDAGSVLNHRHVLERALREVEELTIATLAPEAASFTEFGVSYLYCDLRGLPFRDGWFDSVVSLSTLEHVGMDNTEYGSEAPAAEDPRAEAVRALRELLRVVRPGGQVHISVPFGRRQDHGWLRQLSRADVDDLLRGAGVESHRETVFRHTSRGWRLSGARRASLARYNAAATRARDRAVAARAVICLTIDV